MAEPPEPPDRIQVQLPKDPNSIVGLNCTHSPEEAAEWYDVRSG